MSRICVVGAGPAGLIATKTLVGAGLDVDCYEMSSVIGGHWAFDNPNGRSAVYRSIHLNTTLPMSRLSDFEMPSDWPAFPGHAQVLEWWNAYVDRFGFRERIRLGVEVVEAEALEPRGWRVTTRRIVDGVTEQTDYDALLACSGNTGHPRLPRIPGRFAGALFHAQEYRDPERPVSLSGKRVVVVGIGNTGCEIACEIQKAGAASVSLSARNGTWILPKWREGRPAAEGMPMMHPCDPVPTPLRLLPARARSWVFESLGTLMFRRMFGERMHRFQAQGLPAPPEHPLDKRATVCEPLLEALEQGEIQARPEIARFDGHDVRFADGSTIEADVVICATGFSLRYPYLPSAWADPRDGDLSLFLGTMHPERQDLFVIGVSRPTGAFWPIAEVHAQVAAACLSGRYEPPSPSQVHKRARPILGGRSFNPALFGLAVREELRRGERRAHRRSERG
ncbi:MAG: FAD-dependent oxidoreductase [Myxococcota bacterium]